MSSEIFKRLNLRGFQVGKQIPGIKVAPNTSAKRCQRWCVKLLCLRVVITSSSVTALISTQRLRGAGSQRRAPMVLFGAVERPSVGSLRW